MSKNESFNLENKVKEIIESNGYNSSKNRKLLDELKNKYSDSTIVNKIIYLLDEKTKKMKELASSLAKKLLNKVYEKKGKYSKKTFKKLYDKVILDKNNKYFKKLGYSGLALDEFRH